MSEFLEALFDETVKANPAYRITEKFGRSGVYIPESELSGKLREINETWAVVRLGNRVRLSARDSRRGPRTL